MEARAESLRVVRAFLDAALAEAGRENPLIVASISRALDHVKDAMWATVDQTTALPGHSLAFNPPHARLAGLVIEALALADRLRYVQAGIGLDMALIAILGKGWTPEEHDEEEEAGNAIARPASKAPALP